MEIILIIDNMLDDNILCQINSLMRKYICGRKLFVYNDEYISKTVCFIKINCNILMNIKIKIAHYDSIKFIDNIKHLHNLEILNINMEDIEIPYKKNIDFYFLYELCTLCNLKQFILNISSIWINKKDIKQICDIYMFPALQKLELYMEDCFIVDGLSYFSNFKKSDTLVFLALDFAFNAIDDNLCYYLGYLYESNIEQLHLNLKYNSITNIGIDYLSKLSSSLKLKQLLINISGNVYITDSGLYNIIKLKNINTLENLELNIENNKFDDSYIDYICSALNIEHLKKIILKLNNIGIKYRDIMKLKNAINQLEKIKFIALYLDNNELNIGDIYPILFISNKNMPNVHIYLRYNCIKEKEINYLLNYFFNWVWIRKFGIINREPKLLPTNLEEKIYMSTYNKICYHKTHLDNIKIYANYYDP